MKNSKKTDGVKEICFDLPQFDLKQVNISFDYMRCSKKYKHILGIKVPYPKCKKKRRVLKFGVPHVTWSTTCITIPFVADKGEVSAQFIISIQTLTSAKIDALEDFDEGIDLITANLGIAKKYNNIQAMAELDAELVKLVEMRKSVSTEFDTQIRELEREKAKI